MVDWQSIMDEMEDYNRREQRRKIERLERNGIESIISDYNENIFDFNNLVDYLILAKHYPDEFIDLAISNIADPRDEAHLSSSQLITKAKSNRAIPVLLQALSSEFGWTVEYALRALIAIRSKRKDVRQAMENFKSNIKGFLTPERSDLLKVDAYQQKQIDSLVTSLKKICGVE